jgi:hypothetical protein
MLSMEKSIDLNDNRSVYRSRELLDSDRATRGADLAQIRAAVFRWVKPALAANRTLEPTQVAGFNQVFDDVNGDESWRWGGGFDWRATKQLFFGAEATWRDLNVPFILPDTAVFESWREKVDRAYVYDIFAAREGFFTDLSSTPKNLKTFSIPVAARYFAQNGFFAGFTITYVDQNVVRTPEAKSLGFSDGQDNFVIVDAGLGWRIRTIIFGSSAMTRALHPTCQNAA